MAFSSGTFSLYTPGNPTITGTTIATSWANNTLNDIATGLSTCVLKDGSQTITANIPMGGFKFTGLAAGSASGNSLRYEQVNGILTTAGDTLQASAAGTFARLALGTARQVPTVNAGATALAYANPITLATEQASTSGTSIDFTGIPAGVRRITINFVGTSISGTANWLIQIGDAGGPETSGYLGGSANVNFSNTAFTAGFGWFGNDAAGVYHGRMVLTLENAAAFTWVCSAVIARSDAAQMYLTAGSKSLSAELTQVRITTSNGSDTFDAGVINISYE